MTKFVKSMNNGKMIDSDALKLERKCLVPFGSQLSNRLEVFKRPQLLFRLLGLILLSLSLISLAPHLMTT